MRRKSASGTSTFMSRRNTLVANSSGCSLQRRAARAQHACSGACGPVIPKGVQGPATATTCRRMGQGEAQPPEQQDAHAGSCQCPPGITAARARARAKPCQGGGRTLRHRLPLATREEGHQSCEPVVQQSRPRRRIKPRLSHRGYAWGNVASPCFRPDCRSLAEQLRHNAWVPVAEGGDRVRRRSQCVGQQLLQAGEDRLIVLIMGCSVGWRESAE